jgi:hypothetical protein
VHLKVQWEFTQSSSFITIALVSFNKKFHTSALDEDLERFEA